MEVQAPPGTTVGYIKQDWHPCLPRFSIQGANKETVMKLEGPCFACNCCGDVNFEVRSELLCVCVKLKNVDTNVSVTEHEDLGLVAKNQHGSLQMLQNLSLINTSYRVGIIAPTQMTTCWLWLYFYPTDMRVNNFFF